MLALFVRLLLAGLLGDVIIRKADKSREGKQRHYCDLPPCICAESHADSHRQHAEADDVAERIELDAEALFLIGAVFFRSCDDAVEHIAKARDHQAYDRRGYLTGHGKADADRRGEHSYEGQPDRVIIKSYQFNLHLRFFFRRAASRRLDCVASIPHSYALFKLFSTRA